MAPVLNNPSKILPRNVSSHERVSRLAVVILLLLSSGDPASTLTPRAGSNLNSLLKSYETVRLDPAVGSTTTSRGELAATGRSNLTIHFAVRAFGRNFSVHLRRGDSGFTPDAEVVLREAGRKVKVFPVKAFPTNYVEGYVLGEPNSDVRGHLIDGVFTGILTTSDDTYYIEPARRYFEHADVTDAIVYKESDVRNRLGPRFCFKKKFKNSSLTGAASDATPNVETLPVVVGKVCKLKVVADPQYYGVLHEGSMDRTISSMENYVKEVDRIYRYADFDGNGRPDNVRVRIRRVIVFKNAKDPEFRMRDPKINISQYLDLFSKYSHKGYCAAFAFTYRDFGQILGVAYTGTPGFAGGICYPEQKDGGQTVSSNIGLATFLGPTGPVVVAQGIVLVAHELGHMFGSDHDEELDGGSCFFESVDKHYIMSSKANPGTSAFNRRFSTCSLKAINNNLRVHGHCLYCRGRECGTGRWLHLTEALLWVCLAVHVISPN